MNIDPSRLPIQFGPYRLKQKIASGGMAEIYLAEATGPGGFKKPLVIKMIHHAYSDDQRFNAMFTEEAKILSSLTHGNIVPIFDFGTVDGLLYLAMEFIDGVDAATLMEICRLQGIPLPVETALFIGMGTAAGLCHAHQAHERGIVHRDVSPQNILLSRSGEVKLCDFGLATHTLEEISTNDAIKGKLRYLSPEQARGEPVDGRSDLFSLGVVLFELIAGHHPIPSGSGVTVLQELASGSEYPPLTENAPWLAPEVARAVDKAVAFDKSARYQSGEEMRADLSRVLHRSYPQFTPAALADLVVTVQSVTERIDAPSDETTYHAKLATFASAARASAKASEKRRARLRTAAAIAISAALLLTAGGAVIHYLPEVRPGSDAGEGDHTAESPPREPEKAAPGDPTERGARTAVDAGRPGASSSADIPAEEDAGPKSPMTPRRRPAPKLPREAHTPRAPSTARSLGTVNINAVPWADVSINGVDYTSTPILGLKLKAGKHTAVFVNPELGITKMQTFTVTANETTTVLVALE